MPRYFIHLAFNGGGFHGWQIQPEAPTVQSALDGGLTTLLRTPVETVGCGRTDTGVHASSFYAHFDADGSIDTTWLCTKLNALLPKSIAVFKVFEVDASLHARFSATQRTYTYWLHTRKDPFLEYLSVETHYTLDLEMMNQAGEFLRTVNDFGAFCKVGSDNKTTLCRLDECHWEAAEHRIKLTISADRFLRNMVRSVVGTSIDLGRGKITLVEFKAIVASGNRSEAGTSAPAHGLYLSDVAYPFS
jgi:tRNA pseudouridine38-40 synthase